MRPEEFIDRFREQRASAILRTSLAEAAAPAMNAAVDAGFRIVEFTLNTPEALDRVAEFSARKDLIVGAGTVLSPDDARAAVAAGARFLVSPVVDAAVIRTAAELEVAMMPGAYTPAEMLAAHRLGAPLQKLFPAPTNGPAYVRACLGPMPFLRIVPTSGVDASNASEFLGAGAWAVGFVAPLFHKEDLQAKRWGDVAARAERLLAAVSG